MTRYRYLYTRPLKPPRKGRWHDTMEGAERSAVKAGFGSYDEERKLTFLDGPCRIEKEEK